MGQSGVPRAGQEYPLAVHQLWLSEFMRSETALGGDSVADVCANRGACGMAVDEPQTLPARTSGFQLMARVDPPRNRFLCANVN